MKLKMTKKILKTKQIHLKDLLEKKVNLRKLMKNYCLKPNRCCIPNSYYQVGAQIPIVAQTAPTEEKLAKGSKVIMVRLVDRFQAVEWEEDVVVEDNAHK